MIYKISDFEDIFREIRRSPHITLSLKGYLRFIIKAIINTVNIKTNKKYHFFILARDNDVQKSYVECIKNTLYQKKFSYIRHSLLDIIRKKINLKLVIKNSLFFISLFLKLILFIIINITSFKNLNKFKIISLCFIYHNCFKRFYKIYNFHSVILIMPTSTEGLVLDLLCRKENLCILNFDWGVADFDYPYYKKNQILFIKSKKCSTLSGKGCVVQW